MALNVEIWKREIVNGLFADNSFAANSVDDSAYVNAKTVHVPNAGSPSGVVKDRSELPATITTRTDYDLTYSMSEFTTNPIRISNVEKVELSYDKRNSILAMDRAALIEAVHESLIRDWADGITTKIVTTGASVSPTVSSATGNRKAFTKADVLSVAYQFDKQNIPSAGRFILCDSAMYYELLASLTESEANAFLASANAQTGVLGQLYGFTFYNRATALRCTAAGALAAANSTTATDGAGCLAWQRDCVSRALGEVKMFAQNDDPTYYGDIFSFLVRAGGKYRRYDKKGVAIIYQGTPA